MSETELFGLMAIAQEHQKTAEKAGKQAEAATAALAQAVAMHRQAVGELSKSAQEAIAGAVRSQSNEIAAPIREAAKSVTEAAQKASGAMSGVAWWVYGAVFAFGVLCGVVGWDYYQSRKASQVVPIESVIEYLRENPEAFRPSGGSKRQ